MDEPYKQNEPNPDQSLADVPPKPVFSEELQPERGMFTGTGVMTIVTVIGGAVFLISALTPAVQGATRSSKLIWQQRQAEIEQAECNAKLSDQQQR
jgi:hypothetical protein